MRFSDLVVFLHDDCDSSRRKFSVADINTEFDHVSIYGSTRSIVFSNPVVTFSLNGIIHTEKTELENGSIRFDFTCRDEFTGVEYYEKVILS